MILVPIAALVMLLLIWMAWWIIDAGKSYRQESLLRLLRLATTRGLPIGPAALAVADSFGLGFRRQVLALAEMLHQGVALPDALLKLRDVLPPAARPLFRISSDAATFEKSFECALFALELRRHVWRTLVTRLGYLGLVFMHCLAVITFITMFILPKFQAIYADFEIALPHVTQWVATSTSVMERSGILVLLSLFLMVVVGAFVLYMIASILGYEPLGPIDLPGYLWGGDRATLLRAIAVMMSRNRSASEALARLAEAVPSEKRRRQLYATKERIDAGDPIWETLHAKGLIRASEAALLESAQRAGNVVWALHAAAESIDRRSGYRLQAWIQFLTPAAVIATGAVVGLIVVAYFLPLVHLIELTGKWNS